MLYIGIPTLNSNEWLKITLDSLYLSMRDQLDNFRVYIPNNGDEPLPAWDFHDFYPNLKEEFFDEAIGISPSWNKIIDWATKNNDYEAIFILNDDIKLFKDTIKIMHEGITELGYDLIGATAVNRYVNNPEPRFVEGVHFSCFALSPRCIEVVGKFDEKFKPFFVEDTDYYYRVSQAGLKYGTDRTAQYEHYKIRPRGNKKRDGSMGLTVSQIHNRNRRYFQKKHGIHPKEVSKKMMSGRKFK
jgi:GT2 family glycosyltransferase